MPPAASLPPGLSAIAAKPHPGSAGVDTAGIDTNEADQFAAHFQRLLGTQLAIEVDVGQLPAPAAAGNAPANELAALLPFFEALGLITHPALQAKTNATEPAAGELAIDAAGAVFAAPIKLPTASNPSGVPAISAAQASLQGQFTDQTTTVPTTAHAGNGAPAEELPAGREFSAQLVAAIAAGKETQHSPGTAAAAVQNIVAQAAPGRAMSQEAAPVITQIVGTSGWTEELGNRVTWLANRGESRAELVLTPPQMGRIEVSLAVKGDQATASFASSNPLVREALEAALPRLREVLAEAGIQLGQAQVNAENARQWAQQEKHGDNSVSDHARADPAHDASSTVNSGSLSTTSGLKGGRSLVDVFA